MPSSYALAGRNRDPYYMSRHSYTYRTPDPSASKKSKALSVSKDNVPKQGNTTEDAGQTRGALKAFWSRLVYSRPTQDETSQMTRVTPASPKTNGGRPSNLPTTHRMREVQTDNGLRSYGEVEPNPKDDRMKNAMTALEPVEISSSERPEQMRYEDRKDLIINRPRPRETRDVNDAKALDVGTYRTGHAKLPVKDSPLPDVPRLQNGRETPISPRNPGLGAKDRQQRLPVSSPPSHGDTVVHKPHHPVAETTSPGLKLSGVDADISQDVSITGSTAAPEVFGWTKEHRLLEEREEEPFVVIEPLGAGAYGQVDEVRLVDSMKPTLVRKRFPLPIRKGDMERNRAIIKNEVDVLRKMRHPGIINFIGSYEGWVRNKPYYSLLLHPVGDNDLETFLRLVGEGDLDPNTRWYRKRWIRPWYTDLASALKYLHSQNVRHQDIKPSNIIHKGPHIFLADFGSNGSFQAGQTTSTTYAERTTPMYAAPEADSTSPDRYGRKSDIFGLGCVFCDMHVVDMGESVTAFHEALLLDCGEQRLRYSERVTAIKAYFGKRKGSFWVYLATMLAEDRCKRPSAADVWRYCCEEPYFTR